MAPTVPVSGDRAWNPATPQGHTTFSWRGGSTGLQKASKAPKKKASGSNRKEHMLEVEVKMQDLWEKHKCFESNVDLTREKYMITFPFPYMSGYLHIGHAFSMSKGEIMAGYQRMKGKNVLWAYGFHCTGMPIQAAANRLASEIAQFGNPPVFPKEEEKKPEAGKAKGKKGGKKKGGKGKVASKKSGKKYQWQIMEDFDLSPAQIAKFTDPEHWCQFFPKYCKQHVARLGCKVDWRRSFITTSINPYFDSFIEWQFHHLKEKGLIYYGKRPAVFSPLDKQPCADHDRSEGEGKGVTEYTLIKMKLVDWADTPYCKKHGDKLKALFSHGKPVYLTAATLRPETMYGQTNCFVKPPGDYIAIETADQCIFICSKHAARNLMWQDMTPKQGEFKVLQEVSGWELLGRKVEPPNCIKYKEVHVLPLTTIKMDKGTGLVTSVPSDAPDDYAALMDMKNNAKLREQYYITEEMVKEFDPLPIIEINREEYTGSLSAVDLCIKAGVKSQKEATKLADIKDTCYKLGFNYGKMLVGPFAGCGVNVAKDKVKDQMIKDGLACKYWEPESKVVSRTKDICVVALTEQWFLKYGTEEWADKVRKHFENNMEFYNPKTKERFMWTVDWLKEWACSRTQGLGTILPWDKKWLIESLSDSTIYMAFYTVCHRMQPAEFDGSVPGEIKPEHLNNAFWDYLFLDGAFPADCKVPKKTMKEMRDEFNYWYPQDLRVSGHDLIRNHLTMSIYNHTAIWDKDPSKWTRSYFCNGFTKLDGEKMSKSTGNFILLHEGIEEYSADAIRLTLADAGDSLDDANFERSVANKNILTMTTEERWLQDALVHKTTPMRKGPLNDMDKMFANEINKCIEDADETYSKMQFRLALRASWFNMQNVKKFYVSKCETPHEDLIKRFAEVQLKIFAPICPHFCESLWQQIGMPGLCVNAPWPKADPVDPILSKKYSYLNDISHDARKTLEKLLKKKGSKLAKFTLIVSDGYLQWQKDILGVLRQCHAKEGGEAGLDRNVWSPLVNALPCMTSVDKKSKAGKREMKNQLGFASYMAREGMDDNRGPAALESEPSFVEADFLKNNLSMVSQALELDASIIEVLKASDAAAGKAGMQAKPMKPAFAGKTA